MKVSWIKKWTFLFGDEIGTLANSFNNMLVRIKDYTQRIEKKNLQLDRAYKQVRTSFTISQEINSLSNLKTVCEYLIKKLQQIVTCKTLIVSVVTHQKDQLYIFSDKDTIVLEEAGPQAIKFFSDKEQMSFVSKNHIDQFLSAGFSIMWTGCCFSTQT